MKWWFPARWFGLHHKGSFFDGWTPNQIREWKREQEDKGAHLMVAQPKYERIVRLSRGRWGMTVRRPDGQLAVHEILGRGRLEDPS